ncbi:GNAT family N-acetyltransferase [Pseudonocardia zijingensis]|jgi:predicted GNAT family acetyltransferase|uniref:GNAT family N-acetyltransferase n=1 Tax=Pseudonocardia zijingensis TaxID=153376 RepID=A0ABN1NJ32_9PSEU
MDVTDAPDQRRYEARIDGELAGFTQYRASDRIVTFLHTEVQPGFEGKGVGSALVRGALDDVRAQGKKVRPVCEFVKGYIEKHPDDYGDLVDSAA